MSGSTASLLASQFGQVAFEGGSDANSLKRKSEAMSQYDDDEREAFVRNADIGRTTTGGAGGAAAASSTSSTYFVVGITVSGHLWQGQDGGALARWTRELARFAREHSGSLVLGPFDDTFTAGNVAATIHIPDSLRVTRQRYVVAYTQKLPLERLLQVLVSLGAGFPIDFISTGICEMAGPTAMQEFSGAAPRGESEWQQRYWPSIQALISMCESRRKSHAKINMGSEMVLKIVLKGCVLEEMGLHTLCGVLARHRTMSLEFSL